jgi:hypothetical protein
MNTHTRTSEGVVEDSAERTVRSWPVLLLAAPAFVAIWSGWVGLGELTGFGIVHPLPGIADSVTLNTAITLPIGVEAYAAYALKVWLTSPAQRISARARTFARWSALGSLVLGAAGQVAYHLMTAAGITQAPWQITAAVACLPVAVLGMGAALAHLVAEGHDDHDDQRGQDGEDVRDVPVTSADVPDVPGTSPSVTVTSQDVPAVTAAHPAATGRRTTTQGTTRSSAGRSSRSSTDTAARVARLRERHPDLTAAQIARRLGVTDRTVRRYLAAHSTTTSAPTRDADVSADTALRREAA